MEQDQHILLTSYPVPSTSSAASSPSFSTVAYTNNSREDSRLCVSIPAIGLSHYDSTDQTPLSSINLGPSFRPVTPAVSRSAPAITNNSIRVKGVRKTWVGVKTDLSHESGQGELWTWTEDEKKDGSTEAAIPTKVVHHTSEPISVVLAPRTLPDHLVLLHRSGRLSLTLESNICELASNLGLASSGSSKGEVPLSQSLRLFAISSSKLSSVNTPPFLPESILTVMQARRTHVAFIVREFANSMSSGSQSNGLNGTFKHEEPKRKTKRPSSAEVIEEAETKPNTPASATNSRFEIEAVLIDPSVESENETGGMEANNGTIKVPMMRSFGTVHLEGVQVVTSEDGFVTALNAQGELFRYRLQLKVNSTFATPREIFDPVATQAELTLSPFSTSIRLSRSAISIDSLSMLALHSSFVVLACVQTSLQPRTQVPGDPHNISILVLIVDMGLASVITESTITVPTSALPSVQLASSLSSLSASTRQVPSVNLSLSSLSKSAVSLVVSPKSGSTFTASDPSQAGRNVLFILPLSLPSSSVLAAVVGKYPITRKFFESSTGPSHTSNSGPSSKTTTTLRHPKTSQAKLELYSQCEKAREVILAELKGLLGQQEGTGKNQAALASQCDQKFLKFIEQQKSHVSAYNEKKVETMLKEERARRVALLEERNRDSVSSIRFQNQKIKIEEAIKEAGPGIDWLEVTAKKIPGVKDSFRYKYYDVRRAEEAIKNGGDAEVKMTDLEKEKLTKKISTIRKQEIEVPSSFAIALLRLCLTHVSNTTLDSLGSAVASGKDELKPHPTAIISYLLQQPVVGDGCVEGGLTIALARAGDWKNTQLALETLLDIPEVTTVAILKAVTSAASKPMSSRVPEVTFDSSSKNPPSLPVFLGSFLRSPFTSSSLREAVRLQLNAMEVISILKVLDGWLVWWSTRTGDEQKLTNGKNGAIAKERKRLPIDPFTLNYSSNDSPPPVDSIVNFVQIILDSHFINLLLQRQSHQLLRRLSTHVKKHVALANDLSGLLGALSIYSQAKLERDGVDSMAEKKHKNLGEGMNKRVAAQEKHADIGEYSVETFYF